MENNSSLNLSKSVHALIVNESSIGRKGLKSSLEMIRAIKYTEPRKLTGKPGKETRDKFKTIISFEAASGEEAIACINSNHIDVVFSYHKLPDMPGLQLLRIIRNDPQIALLPFILLTEVTDRKEFINAIELGVSDYLLMPFSLQSLEERVTRALEGVKSQLIQWRETLSVGDEEIDRQHKRLINLINEIHNSIITGKGRDTVKWVMDELVDYTKTHFGFEESFMEKIRYPHVSEHKLEHQGLTDQVLQLQSRSMQPNLEVGLVLETLNFLKDWLVRHIMASDTKCLRYAKMESSPSSENAKTE